MSGPFKVGEICIMQHLTECPEYNGEECVITGDLAPRIGLFKSGEFRDILAYEVAINGGFGLAYAHQLRRRKPPTTDSGEQRIIAMLRDAKAPQRVGEPA